MNKARKLIPGYIPDDKDERDYMYSVPAHIAVKLPDKVDLTSKCPAVYDQGQLGSCTANAIAAAHQFEQIKQGIVAPFTPARLFIYYNERKMEGTVNQDSGAQIRDGMKSIAVQGVCPETELPYDTTKFRVKPSTQCYKDALLHQAVTYYSVKQLLDQVQGCLAAGYPVVFGFSVYESFESAAVAKTGKVNMPKSSEQCVGGHAVMAVGYDNPSKRFIVRNSWGVTWGMKGYFTMPMDYLLDPSLANDFWTVRLVGR